MKIVMTLMVKNEADILARNIEFHRQQGVSHFLITDHRSSDESLAIASHYEALGLADVFTETSDQFRQGEWVTRMARLASSKHKADWVINSDADEFWLPARGDLLMALSDIDPQVTSLTLPRFNVVYCHTYSDIVLEGKVRYRSALAELPKTCHRGDPAIQISEGNHLAVSGLGQVRRHVAISILHYPVRSYEQFQRKVVEGAANLERTTDLDPMVGWHWRQAAAAHRAGQLRQFFLANLYCGEIVMDAITLSRKLETRTLVHDERIARFFQGTSNELEPHDPSGNRFSLIQLVSTTRLEAAAFWSDTLLGCSLRQAQHRELLTRIQFTNHQPLAVAYNAAIEAAPAGSVLVFCHDDIDLGPEPLGHQLKAALARFDLVGVAGNHRHQRGQIAWWLDPQSGGWDHPFLSGALRHGTPERSQLNVFGPAPMPVELLDGVFLAARADTLRRSGVRFDPCFASHYYDLDLSRSARRAGLSLGTWPLPLVHASGGELWGETWQESQQAYLRKWKEGSELCQPAKPASPALLALFQSARAFEKAQAWAEAERCYRQLLEQAPAHGATRLQLAKVLHCQGRDGEALSMLDALLDGPLEASTHLRARAHTNRGALLQLRGDLDAAQRDHGEALRLDPALKIAGDNLLALALLLRSQGRSHQALEALRMILRATPQRPDLLLQLGTTLMDLGRVEAAVPCFRRLLRKDPQLSEGHYQLGQALAALGHTEAGIAELNTALAIDPAATEVLVQLEMHRLSLCDWDNYESRMVRLVSQLDAYGQANEGDVPTALVPPLSVNLFPASLALQRRLGERWAEPTSRSMDHLRLPPAPLRQPGERWRIGYLSADFRNHPMGNLLHGLFACHNRQRYEVFAYSLVDVFDEVTEVIRSGVDHFALVAAESSEAIAQSIRADRIDVLIDLMGHTHHGRPGVLALRPAPLQLHYLGYPGSLGADWIDGVIADAWLIPPEHEIYYRETVHRLPWGFVSSDPLPNPADPAPPPLSRESLGLPADAVVYACFNRPEKITPAMFESWLEILRQVPGSLLWIINDHPLVEQRMRGRLAAAGLEPQRLVFSPKLESAAFGQACALADLLLDTSPYGSGATAATALAAGLPLLTCPGDTFASRMGASLCAATGLEELICPTPETYLQRAIELGRQPAKLQRLRRQLLEGHGKLPLFNTAAWVGHLEALLEQLMMKVH